MCTGCVGVGSSSAGRAGGGACVQKEEMSLQMTSSKPTDRKSSYQSKHCAEIKDDKTINDVQMLLNFKLSNIELSKNLIVNSGLPYKHAHQIT